MRASAFAAAGGFDAVRYPRPSIEDIEFGARLSRAGFETRLVKTAQATHLKAWSLGALVRTDVVDRALPWGRLMMTSGVRADLNVRWSHRVSGVLAWTALAAFAFALERRLVDAGGPAGWAALVSTAALMGVVALNTGFYAFLMRQGGWWFAARAVPLHFLYYLYGSAVFALCAIEALATRPDRRVDAAPQGKRST